MLFHLKIFFKDVFYCAININNTHFLLNEVNLWWQMFMQATVYCESPGYLTPSLFSFPLDIKPENLLISSDDVLKLCDFGEALC